MKQALVNILEGVGYTLADIFVFFSERHWGVISFVGGIMLAVFKKYIFGDIGFLPWLALIVLFDTLAGYRAAVALHKQQPDLHARPTGARLREKLASKLTSYAIALVALNTITNFEVDGQRAQDILSDMEILGLVNLNFLKIINYSAVMGFMLFELRSIQRNLKVTGFSFLNFKIEADIDKFLGKDGDKDRA